MKDKTRLCQLLPLALLCFAVSYISAEGFQQEEVFQRIDNLSISMGESSVTLNWAPTANAREYKVYSSSVSDGAFLEDLGGVFEGTSWTCPLYFVEVHKFFYVTSIFSVLTIQAYNNYGAPLPAWVYLNGSYIGEAPLTLNGYAPGTYSVWYPPPYPDGSYIWEPTEVTLGDNLIDRNLVFVGFYWLK